MPAPFLLPLLVAAIIQQPAADPRQAAVQASAQAEQIQHAEDLLEHSDFTAAEPALADLARSHPKDAHILFDLGFSQERNGHEAAAETSYAAAIAADSTLAEPRIALGLLQARSGQMNEGTQTLRQAVELPNVTPALQARALRALARLDQTSDPAKARDELAQAIQLTGQQPGDADLTALLTASSTSDTESAYRHTLAQSPDDIAATVELASLLQKQNRLGEADALLAPALAAHPNDARLVAQTAVLYAAEDKNSDALHLLENLRAADSQARADTHLTRLYAHLLLLSGDAARAEPLYRALATKQPNDPSLLDDLGSALVREQNFQEAQAVFTKAVAQREAFHDDAAWGEAAGHLAFSASRNHQPAVVLQALQARATVLPTSASTQFLEATAQDTLHHRKEAERAYRAFLALANGKLPDEEFEARHRLIALEHEH